MEIRPAPDYTMLLLQSMFMLIGYLVEFSKNSFSYFAILSFVFPPNSDQEVTALRVADLVPKLKLKQVLKNF